MRAGRRGTRVGTRSATLTRERWRLRLPALGREGEPSPCGAPWGTSTRLSLSAVWPPCHWGRPTRAKPRVLEPTRPVRRLGAGQKRLDLSGALRARRCGCQSPRGTFSVLTGACGNRGIPKARTKTLKSLDHVWEETHSGNFPNIVVIVLTPAPSPISISGLGAGIVEHGLYHLRQDLLLGGVEEDKCIF